MWGYTKHGDAHITVTPATDYPRASRSFQRIAGSGNEIARDVSKNQVGFGIIREIYSIVGSDSAISSQYPHTLRFFPREVKNIKNDRCFPQGLERSNPHENYPHMHESYIAELIASRGGADIQNCISSMHALNAP